MFTLGTCQKTLKKSRCEALPHLSLLRSAFVKKRSQGVRIVWRRFCASASSFHSALNVYSGSLLGAQWL
jgi:hypothetical protein